MTIDILSMGRKSKVKKVRFKKSVIEISEVLKYISYTQLTGKHTKFYIDKKDDIIIKNIIDDADVDSIRIEFKKNIRYTVKPKKKEDKNVIPDSLSDFFNIFKME
jgi:hypothetical protein